MDPFSTNSQVMEFLWKCLLLYMKHIIKSLFVGTNFIMPIVSDVKSYTHWLPLVPNLQCRLGDILAQPAFTCFYRHSVKMSEYETRGHYFALYQSIDPTNLWNGHKLRFLELSCVYQKGKKIVNFVIRSRKKNFINLSKSTTLRVQSRLHMMC